MCEADTQPAPDSPLYDRDTDPCPPPSQDPTEVARLRQLAAQALKPVPLPTRLGAYSRLVSTLSGQVLG